jgi:flagellar basal-body rod protein FlgB
MASQPSVVDILDAGLRASLMRQKVVANNLANVDTPGFRRNDVEFEDVLANALDSPTGLTKQECQELTGTLRKPMNTPVKANGNDVNLDLEVGELLKSASRHKTSLRILNKLYKQMEMAMQSQV